MQILSPEVIVPATIFLASQDASGVTGQHIDALDWNIEHSLGETEKWLWRKASWANYRSQYGGLGSAGRPNPSELATNRTY